MRNTSPRNCGCNGQRVSWQKRPSRRIQRRTNLRQNLQVKRPLCRADCLGVVELRSTICCAVSWLTPHDARREFNQLLPPAEKDAMVHVIELLEENGERLGHPYTSDARIAENLRELRQRK